jgi:hypothetical protein
MVDQTPKEQALLRQRRFKADRGFDGIGVEVYMDEVDENGNVTEDVDGREVG